MGSTGAGVGSLERVRFTPVTCWWPVVLFVGGDVVVVVVAVPATAGSIAEKRRELRGEQFWTFGY